MKRQWSHLTPRAVVLGNIGLLALDFDLTVVDIHTGGQWTQGEHALVRHVRPHMQCLLRNGLLQGLHVAIASFSAQEALIRETLRLALQPVNITKMIVVGGDNYSEETGKCRHLRTIRAVLAESSDSVTSSTTILIDDDKRNIRLADADGYQSLWFDPDHPERLFQRIMSLQDGEQKKRIYPYSA